MAGRLNLRDAPPPRGPMSLVAQFGDNPGQLQMLRYAPPGLHRGAPLVVVLHGCGQEASAFAEGAGWLTLADRLGFAVLAPRQTAANNPNRCFNWFVPRHTRRGGGEAASIAAMVRSMLATDGLDPARVFITGLSAGGAMALAMLATYPELFAGGAVFGALPYGVADDLAQAMTAMHQPPGASGERLGRLVRNSPGRALPPLTIWHGAADAVVAPGNAEAIAAQWALAQGLAQAPDETEVGGGRSRAVWRRPGNGDVAIELNIIDALGHGVPLATKGGEGLGRIAPFMLEAGISSSREVARFWGLDPSPPPARLELLASPPMASAESSAPRRRLPPPPRRSDPRPCVELGGGEVGARVMDAIAAHVPTGVQDTIAKALKAAGLMR